MFNKGTHRLLAPLGRLGAAPVAGRLVSQAPVAARVAYPALNHRLFSSNAAPATPLRPETLQAVRALSDAPVIARELMIRDLVASAAAGNPGMINVSVNPEDRTITVADSGLGLSRAELEAKFQQLHTALSASESVSILSKQPGMPALRLTSDGAGFTVAEEAAESLEGTRVTCRVRDMDAFKGLVDINAARAMAQQAAKLAGMPVSFQSGAEETLLNPECLEAGLQRPAAPQLSAFDNMMRGIMGDMAANQRLAGLGMNGYSLQAFMGFGVSYVLAYRNIFIWLFRVLFQTFRPLIAVYVGGALIKTVFSLTLSTSFLLFFSLIVGFEVFYLLLQIGISYVFMNFFMEGMF